MSARLLTPEQLEEALSAIPGDAGLRDDVAAHIAALEAEVARLKPSGQVEEDVAAAASLLSGAIDGVGDGPRYDRLAAAISLLSTKAHAYDAAVADLERYRADDDANTAAIVAAGMAPMNTAEAIAVLARERDAAVADNAAKDAAFRAYVEIHGVEHETIPGSDLPCPEDDTCECPLVVALSKAFDPNHPGAALLDELATLRQREALWNEAATTLYGHTVFVGPCVHGRDPWDRCDECGEESAVHALVKLVAKKDQEHRKELVRARNEGLEGLSKRLLERRDQMQGRTNEQGRRRGLEEAAAIARAMKEPEQ